MRNFEGERSDIKEVYVKKCAVLGEFILNQVLMQGKVKDMVSELETHTKDYHSLSTIIDAITESVPAPTEENLTPDVRFDPVDADRELMIRLEEILFWYNEKWNSMGDDGINWRDGLNKHYLNLIREEIK